MPARLSDLRPVWWAEPGRHGQGITIDCPCCIGKPHPVRLALAFDHPLDGGAPIALTKLSALMAAITNGGDWGNIVPPGVYWHREGDTFETLSLSPSVNAEPAGHWHGYVSGGVVTP